MAKVVSQKREIVTAEDRKADTGEMRASPVVTGIGVFLVVLFVVGAIAMVLMTFNYQQA